MKIKAPSKIKKAAFALPKQINPADGIPAFLKEFEGKTYAQVFGEMGISPEQHEAIAGLIFGFIGEIGLTIPEFSKSASKLFWKNYFGKELNINESLEDLGVASRIIEIYSEKQIQFPSAEMGNSIMTIAKPLFDLLEKAARAETPEKTAMFYNGRARGEKILEKMNNPEYLKMVRRAPIYYVIAGAWRVFEKFSSQAEAERWLHSNKIITGNIDSSEVRAIFRKVGLRYRAPGRPKKSETGRSVSDESVFDGKAESVLPPI